MLKLHFTIYRHKKDTLINCLNIQSKIDRCEYEWRYECQIKNNITFRMTLMTIMPMIILFQISPNVRGKWHTDNDKNV